MTTFTIKPGEMGKWIHQNQATYTGDFFEGVLLDNYILDCKRGFAFVYEHYINPNSIDYIIYFVPFTETDIIDHLYSVFIDQERETRREYETA